MRSVFSCRGGSVRIFRLRRIPLDGSFRFLPNIFLNHRIYFEVFAVNEACRLFWILWCPLVQSTGPLIFFRSVCYLLPKFGMNILIFSPEDYTNSVNLPTLHLVVVEYFQLSLSHSCRKLDANIQSIDFRVWHSKPQY